MLLHKYFSITLIYKLAKFQIELLCRKKSYNKKKMTYLNYLLYKKINNLYNKINNTYYIKKLVIIKFF